MLALSPLFAAAIGSNQALLVKRGHGERIVLPRGIASGLLCYPAHPLEYIGFLNGTFAIYESAGGNVILIKQVDGQALVLARNPHARSVQTQVREWWKNHLAVEE
jgi:hypothetical protein